MIEHVDTIVELRRGLVLNESRFPDELKNDLCEPGAQLHAVGVRPFHAGRLGRRAGHPAHGRKKQADVLFWVGCAGSYDARYQKVSRAVCAGS